LKDTKTASENQIADPGWFFPLKLDWLKSGISTAADGGMAWGRSPDQEVASNRRRFIESQGLRPDFAVAINQIHGCRIIAVGEKDANRGISESSTRIPDVDGLITDTPELVLVTSHGDCAPVFLADTKHRAIGLIHAGWKGTLAGIAGKAIARMSEEYRTQAEDLFTAIGPMISTSNYEVSAERAQQFSDCFGNQVVNRAQGRWHLDLFACLVVDLLRHGLLASRIPTRPPCTFKNREFSSFRRDGENMKGMLASFCISP
jgi:polyphenol oxidase